MTEGRTRRKLRIMLEGLGMSGVELCPVRGAWRIGWCDMPPDERGVRLRLSLCSWSTMADIVRSGGVVVEVEDSSSAQLHPLGHGVSRIERAG